MCLYWGVIPVAGAPVDDGQKLLEHVVAQGRAAGHFSAGDRVVLVYGTGISTSRHNMVVVHQID
jgi:pyruvate kinase